MGSVMTIGIAGGTGSGKTTITRRLLQKFSSNVSVIYHDNYYKAHNDLNYEQRSLLNYDCPDAFDTELMLRDLKRLRAGEAIRCPVYDYTIHNRSEKTVLVKPSPVVIVEGILILQDPRLCELLDIKIFVDTDADVRIPVSYTHLLGHRELALFKQAAVLDDVYRRARVHVADDGEVNVRHGVDLDDVLAPHELAGGVFYYGHRAVELVEVQQPVELHGSAGVDVVDDYAVFDGIYVHVTPPAASV